MHKVLLLVFIFSTVLDAHPGHTDKNGGHTNSDSRDPATAFYFFIICVSGSYSP